MEIATVKGCTPVQVLVAYNLIQGLSCVPKSRSAERIEQNFLVRILKLKLFVRVSSNNRTDSTKKNENKGTRKEP